MSLVSSHASFKPASFEQETIFFIVFLLSFPQRSSRYPFPPTYLLRSQYKRSATSSKFGVLKFSMLISLGYPRQRMVSVKFLSSLKDIFSLLFSLFSLFSFFSLFSLSLSSAASLPLGSSANYDVLSSLSSLSLFFSVRRRIQKKKPSQTLGEDTKVLIIKRNWVRDIDHGSN